MPKATKKKKDKEADFKKAKLKLGKGKKVPSNATDTSFKARSIALPEQNPLLRALADRTADSAAEATTSQGLSLDEVLVRFRHPNGGVRRDAITGLKEILAVKPEREVGKVIRALGGQIADDDASVRKALLHLMEWYIPANDEGVLTPHLPLLLLQTSSALSHIFPEVRLDAAKLVHLLLQHVPAHITSGWPHAVPTDGASSSRAILDRAAGGGSTILEGLRLALGVGGERTSSAQSGRISAAAKLVLLKALLAFVSKALGAGADAGPGEDSGKVSVPKRTFRGWLADERSERGGKGKVFEVPPTAEQMLQEGWLGGIGDWALQAESDPSWEIACLGAGGTLSDEGNVAASLSQLYLQLHPLLLSTFLESAPTAFSVSQTSFTPNPSGSEDISLTLCTVCASLSDVLAAVILGQSTPSSSTDEVRSAISDFLRRMAAWFPFRLPKAVTSSGLSPAFSLSLSYANLAVLLAPRPPKLVFPRGLPRELGVRGRVRAVEQAWGLIRDQAMKAKGKGKAGGADVWALEEVAQWVVDVLSPSKDALAPLLTPAAYAALLPIIFALLTQPPPPRSAAEDVIDIPALVGRTFLHHLSCQASTSAIKALGDHFVILLFGVHDQRHPELPFFISTTSPLRVLLRTWFEGVPKTLWELGSRDEATTERLLRFLLDTGLRGTGALEPPFSLLEATAFPAVTAKLAPFFYLTHPTRGLVPGPWTKLDSAHLRKLGLEVAQVRMEWDERGALRKAVDEAGRACGLSRVQGQ